MKTGHGRAVWAIEPASTVRRARWPGTCSRSVRCKPRRWATIEKLTDAPEQQFAVRFSKANLRAEQAKYEQLTGRSLDTEPIDGG
jgi:hypothetical protein